MVLHVKYLQEIACFKDALTHGDVKQKLRALKKDTEMLFSKATQDQ